MAEPFDYLFLEPLLVERVRSELPGLALVGGVPDLATVAGQQQASPAVYLIYLGDELAAGPAALGGQGRVQTVTQRAHQSVSSRPACRCRGPDRRR